MDLFTESKRSLIGNVLFGVAAAALVVGWSSTPSDDDDTVTPSPTATATGATPTATPTNGQGTPTAVPTATELSCRTIVSIQDPSAADHPQLGDRVLVCGAIVTAIRFDGTIVIGDPAGGAYSGIYVFQPNGATFIPSTIALGDEIDIVAEYALNFGAPQLSLFSDEVPASSVTLKSSNNTLPPAVVISDASTVATLCNAQSSGADAAKYEGVRLTLSGSTVTDLNPCEQGGFGVFEIDSSLWIDDDFGLDFTPVAVNEELESVTGILHYAFDHFRLFPGPGDVVSAGNVTPPPCDGLPITALQNDADGAHPAPGALQSVCGVIVTAVKPDAGFIVQDPTGGAWSGIYVFKGNGPGPAPKVGDAVNVTGKFELFFGAYQLNMNNTAGAALAIESSDNSLPEAIAIADVATIATPCVNGATGTSAATARQYEGTRVTFGPTTITDLNPCDQGLGAEDDFGVFEVGGSLFIDDDYGLDFDPTAEDLNKSLTSVTGVLHLTFDHYRAFPGPGDIIVAQ